MDRFDPATIGVRSGHFIGGSYVDDDLGPRIEVARPSDGVLYASVPVADAATIDRAVQNAWAAWRLRCPISSRGAGWLRRRSKAI